MDLKQFIKQSVIDILDAVTELQKETTSGNVIPVTNESIEAVKVGNTMYQTIDFEIAVNVVEKEGVEAKLNVITAVINGGLKGDNSSTSGQSSKLKFSIPIKFNTYE